MNRFLGAVLVAAGLVAGIGFVSTPAHAQFSTRAYAPENLRTLSQQDQVRVISLEYSEQSRGRRIPDDQLRFYLDQVNRSNWTFSRIKQDIAQSIGGSGGGWNPEPTYPGNGDTIRCESDRGATRTCNTPWRGGSRIARQLSDTRCVEGSNWTSVAGRVTVMGGCRAEFEQDSGSGWGGGNGREIRCESLNNRYKECAVGSANAYLVRQLSDTRCSEGSTWGQRGNVLWVNRGCRGVFMVGGSGGGHSGGGYTVSCASESGRTQSCAWNHSYGRPTLQRQLSSSPCREGSTWWYRNGAIVVSGGCRGVFSTR